MTEHWLPIVGYEGMYEVSDLGRVRSLDRIDSSGARRRGKMLKLLIEQTAGQTQYFGVRLSKNSKVWPYRVHRLVLDAFVGPCPDGKECCHLNDIGTDNRLENLRWDVHKANARDQVRNAHHFNDSKTHCEHGHEFTPENTMHVSRRLGGRKCRECKRQRDIEYRERKKRKKV
jgi:hypothetical protein